METPQFFKASDVAESLGYVLTRGVGGRLFVVWRRGTNGRKSNRFDSIKAAIAHCREHAIPADFPVKPLMHSDSAIDRCQCGECGLSWDDGKVTGWTPSPAGRCPFEYFHN